MTVTQAAKAQQFRALHKAPDAFVVANVWDGGSARMMAALGFAALATSSGASAGLLGRRDGRVTRDEALAQARVICNATDLPISADLEKGFGDAPEIVAETIRLATEAGLVGCSIGADALMAPGLPDLEPVRAVCAAVGKPFNFMVGIKGKSFTVAALAAAGVKRISLATSLYRAAMTGLLSAAKEVREHGTFGYIDTSLATPDMNAFLRE